MNVTIESEIPVKAGLSSSSAVLCAALFGIAEFFDLPISTEKCWELMQSIQAKIHGGSASGAEIVSSLLGGLNFISVKDGIKWKSLASDLKVVIGDTRVPAATRLTVGYHVPSLIDRWPSHVEDCFDEIEAITNDAKNCIRKGKLEELGKLVDKNHRILRELGLSHPKLEDCISAAKKAGALGAKLSGGGWGGVMFALARPGEEDKIVRAIERTRAPAIKADLGVEGVIRE